MWSHLSLYVTCQKWGPVQACSADTYFLYFMLKIGIESYEMESCAAFTSTEVVGWVLSSKESSSNSNEDNIWQFSSEGNCITIVPNIPVVFQRLCPWGSNKTLKMGRNDYNWLILFWAKYMYTGGWWAQAGALGRSVCVCVRVHLCLPTSTLHTDVHIGTKGHFNIILLVFGDRAKQIFIHTSLKNRWSLRKKQINAGSKNHMCYMYTCM